MKLNNILMASVSTILALSSCSEDFLETAPTDSITPELVYSNTNNVKAAVNGIAYMMRRQQSAFSQGFCGENAIISIFNEYPSQEFRYNQMAQGWKPIMNGEYYTRNSSTYCTYPWAYYYQIVAQANAIIANVDKAEGKQDDKDFYKAQALTFRAYAFTKLLEIYTPRWTDVKDDTKGVVLRLDESLGDHPLSTVKECYDQIYTDLDEAIALFTSSKTKREITDIWVPNINVAHGVYARAALHKQDYPKALENAKLAQKDYKLMSNSEYIAGFATPTSEWLFGSYDSPEETTYYWSFGKQFSCNGNDATKTKYGAGAIEKELTDRMPVNDVRMSLFLTADKFEGFDLTDKTVMNQTYGYIVSDDAWDVAREYCNSMTPVGYNKPYQSGYYYLGAQLKFWVFDTPGVSYVPFMRVSEMVLIEAEANYCLGNESGAQAALVHLNAESGRNPEYTCDKTGDDLFQEIVDYRELELWGEGFNWYDIKRWGRDIVRKSFAEGGNCHVATAGEVKATEHDQWTWRIPELETLYNGAVEE